jgi:hypothetical protein
MTLHNSRDDCREMLDQGFREGDYDSLPTRMLPILYGYVVDGRQPGSFLQAVIENNLNHALMFADAENFAALKSWSQFFYDHTPSQCWGSREIMQAYTQAKEEECNA